MSPGERTWSRRWRPPATRSGRAPPRPSANRVRRRRPTSEQPTTSLAAARRASLFVQAVVSISVALAIMVLMAGPADLATMEERNLLALIPATIVQAWAGRRFYRSAWRAARHGSSSMDTLVAIGTSAAWALQRRADARAGDGPGRRPGAGHLLRQRRDHHRARPARPMARGSREGPDDRRHPSTGRAAPDLRPARPWLARGGRRARVGRRRRSPACPSR